MAMGQIMGSTATNVGPSKRLRILIPICQSQMVCWQMPHVVRVFYQRTKPPFLVRGVAETAMFDQQTVKSIPQLNFWHRPGPRKVGDGFFFDVPEISSHMHWWSETGVETKTTNISSQERWCTRYVVKGTTGIMSDINSIDVLRHVWSSQPGKHE